MGFNAKTWLCAFAAAALNTFVVFYGNLYGVEVTREGMRIKPAVLWLSAVVGVLTIAAYVFVGRKDEGKQLIYRFVQFDLLSFICSYGGYIVYSKTAGMRGEDFPSSTSVFNVLVPSSIGRGFHLTVLAGIICTILWLRRKAKGISVKMTEEELSALGNADTDKTK